MQSMSGGAAAVMPRELLPKIIASIAFARRKLKCAMPNGPRRQLVAEQLFTAMELLLEIATSEPPQFGRDGGLQKLVAIATPAAVGSSMGPAEGRSKGSSVEEVGMATADVVLENTVPTTLMQGHALEPDRSADTPNIVTIPTTTTTSASTSLAQSSSSVPEHDVEMGDAGDFHHRLVAAHPNATVLGATVTTKGYCDDDAEVLENSVAEMLRTMEGDPRFNNVPRQALEKMAREFLAEVQRLPDVS